MTRKLILIISIFLFSLHFGYAQNEVKRWTPSVDLGYAFGGNFYLNYLESNPMWSIHFGLDKLLDQKASFGFRLGYEGLRDEGFLPLLVRYTRHLAKSDFYLHGGYAFGFYHDIDDIEELKYTGGLALGVGYTHRLLQTEGYELGVNVGYDHRNSTLELSSVGGNNIDARSSYHYLNLGLCLTL